MFLGFWVYFFVPETKGVRIEDMDKLFGGNQGAEDMQRIAVIRAQLGLGGGSGDIVDEKASAGSLSSQVERVEKA